MRAWADLDDAVAGLVKIDLVGHEGGNSSEEFCFTLAKLVNKLLAQRHTTTLTNRNK